MHDFREHVHNQDCLEYLKTVANNTFDLVIADPPYFTICGEFDFIWSNLDEYLAWSQSWIREVHRVLKQSGSFYLWGKIGFGKGYALFKLADWFETEKLFSVRNWITQRNTRGRGTKRGYMEAREELIFATKSGIYTWNPAYTAEGIDRTDPGFDGKPRKNQFKRVSDVWIDISEASQSSRQRFKLLDAKSFPTVKALDLCERIISASSNPGDYVYIPFGGSGSEAVACQTLGRRWELTEINTQYVEDLVIPRLCRECSETALGANINSKLQADSLTCDAKSWTQAT